MAYNFQPKRLLCCTKLRSLGKSEKTWIRSGKKPMEKWAKQVTNPPKKPPTRTRVTHNTILSDKRIIRSAEIDEPVPLAAPQQHCHGVEGGGQHCGPSVSHQIAFLDHPHITHLAIHRIFRHVARDLLPLRLGRAGVEM